MCILVQSQYATAYYFTELLLVRYSDVRYSNGSWVFRPPFEYRTKFSPVFKWHLNNGPFGDQTTFDHINSRLVQYSDPHCTGLVWDSNVTKLFSHQRVC